MLLVCKKWSALRPLNSVLCANYLLITLLMIFVLIGMLLFLAFGFSFIVAFSLLLEFVILKHFLYIFILSLRNSYFVKEKGGLYLILIYHSSMVLRWSISRRNSSFILSIWCYVLIGFCAEYALCLFSKLIIF